MVVKGSIIPLVCFDEINSTKDITDDLSSMKLDIYIFTTEDGKAQGHVYLDDMLTFAPNHLFLELSHDGKETSVKVHSNNFSKVTYDESKPLAEQTFVNKVIII